MTGVETTDLGEAYRAHAPAVFRRARTILGSAAEAEEVVQELFESLAAAPHALQHTESPAAWFYTTTTNRCINRLRDQNNRLRLIRDRIEPPQVRASAVEDAVVLRELLSRLPEQLANVAVYYYADEMTHDEIAKLLGCSRRHVGDLVERLHDRVNAREDQA